jgi:hypothetical protein
MLFLRPSQLINKAAMKINKRTFSKICLNKSQFKERRIDPPLGLGL